MMSQLSAIRFTITQCHTANLSDVMCLFWHIFVLQLKRTHLLCFKWDRKTPLTIAPLCHANVSHSLPIRFNCKTNMCQNRHITSDRFAVWHWVIVNLLTYKYLISNTPSKSEFELNEFQLYEDTKTNISV
jgi:hypothetical protein